MASPLGEMLPGLTECCPLLSQAVMEPGSERSQPGAAEMGQPVGVGAEPLQPCQQEVDGSLEAFIQGVSKPAAAAILMTPTKKTKATRAPEATRRSGRIAVKTQKKGRKSTEVMAQEILCKKLDGDQSHLDN